MQGRRRFKGEERMSREEREEGLREEMSVVTKENVRTEKTREGRRNAIAIPLCLFSKQRGNSVRQKF